MTERIVGIFEGQEPGPLLIALGGMHGNEPAGPDAIREVFRLLSIEVECNPAFSYRGTFVGILGNLDALEKKQRFISQDLNRMLIQEEINRVESLPISQRTTEEQQLLVLLDSIKSMKDQYKSSLILILDLHTTTAGGGIFTIAALDDVSRKLAKGLHAPVILGFDEDLQGTTLQYFNRPEIQEYCIVFEAGQHHDPDSVHRSAAAIINCMRTIGAVDSKHVDHRHDGILKQLSEGLPKVTKLVYHYRIRPDEQFVMNPGYINFQKVAAGEVLATNQFGQIASPQDGLMLMPKYQPQGDDGFFLVEELE